MNYGLKVFRDRKALPYEHDKAEHVKEGGGISTTHRRSSKPGTRLSLNLADYIT